MPIRKSDYPPDWPAISLQVREEAGQRCEWCGAPNRKVIRRPKAPMPETWHSDYPGCDWVIIRDIEETNGEIIATGELSWARLRFHGLTKVILTVAHLDRDSQNNARSNLAALCQRCHLRHDIRQHVATRRYGRDYAKEQQLKLI